ncbi:MAG: Asp-tRNA(Asn)/Glu-tRNA(Gln) amidotransferase GatCAB subunit C [Phycisphaerae bacterium]|nr:Asp-tRNA(Asn)/Glu-tRNA(Gln) amidotransferase GatCAB subunit C [Phycisphaerae bacterium]
MEATGDCSTDSNAPELTRDEVARIARLCKLELNAEELEDARDRLTAVLGHFRCLAALDLEGVEPMAHAHDEPCRLRPDDVGGPLVDGDTLRAMAPRVFESHVQTGGDDGESRTDVFFHVPSALGDGGGA